MARLKQGWVETRPLADGSFKSLLRYRDPLTGEKMVYGGAAYGSTKDEAKEQAAELQPQLVGYLAQRTNARREPAMMALGDWVLGRWRKEFQPKLPPSTKSRMEQWWRKWLEPLVGNAPLGHLTPELIEGMVEHMHQAGAQWPTIEAAVKDIRRYLRDAVAAKPPVLSESPLRDFRLEAPELTPDEIRELGEEPEFALELEHAVRIAWCMNGLDDVALAESMCIAALRPGETRALMFTNVLHPDGRARSQLSVRLGVSGRGSARQLRGTKKTRGRGRGAIRRGFRSPRVQPSLGRLFQLIWDERGRPPMAELLAPGAAHGKGRMLQPALGVKNEANWRRREFYPAVARAGVQELYPRKITPKEFRAAAAAAYGYAREEELSARAQLGHSSDSTTLGFYFAAYDDPNPELRGRSVEWQLQRARRLTLEWMERRIIELGEQRVHIGEESALVWEQHGHDSSAIFTADCIKSSRYAVWIDGGSWYASFGPNAGGSGDDVNLTAGRVLEEKLPTVEDAQRIAELHARKRIRQSLTIQRQHFEAMIPHLRMLVAAADVIQEQ